MVELYVYPFNDRRHAWEVHASLMREAYGYLVDAGDVALLMRGLDGQYQIGRTDDLEPTASPFPWRLLIGAMVGTLPEPRRDWNRAFAATLRDRLTPDTSALFVLRRQFAPEQAYEDLARFAGKPMRLLLGEDTLSAIGEPEG